MPLKLLNWNVEWAAAKWKAAELQRRIAQARRGHHLSHRDRHWTLEAA